jgi:hypothetical protein
MDRYKRLIREKELASRPKKPDPVVVMPPPAPAEDPRIAEARIGLPPGWQPLISRRTNKVYYYNPNEGNQYERPTMGGKRTKRHSSARSKSKSRSKSKQPKRKRTTTRRKRTTTRRK